MRGVKRTFVEVMVEKPFEKRSLTLVLVSPKALCCRDGVKNLRKSVLYVICRVRLLFVFVLFVFVVFKLYCAMDFKVLFDGHSGLHRSLVFDERTFFLEFFLLRLFPLPNYHPLMMAKGSVLFYVLDHRSDQLCFVLAPFTKLGDQLHYSYLFQRFPRRLEFLLSKKSRLKVGFRNEVHKDESGAVRVDVNLILKIKQKLLVHHPYEFLQTFLAQKGLFVSRDVIRDLWLPLEAEVRLHLDTASDALADHSSDGSSLVHLL